MKRIVSLLFGLALFVGVTKAALAASGEFTFQEVVYPGDTFTQLLGINNDSTIAGYHGATVNKGFVFTLPSTFTDENYPGSAQTQVIGINNSNQNDGFYIDTSGKTHGFLDNDGTFETVTDVGTVFNQLLGLNDEDQAVGYFGNSAGGGNRGYIYDELGAGPLSMGAFLQLTVAIKISQTQITGINNSGQICGFYVDGSGKTHGFLAIGGTFATLDFPAATFTQALGLNNTGLVVGTYLDSSNASHGFIYNPTAYAFNYDSVDDPSGIGTTVINGLNDRGRIVGFYVDSSGNTDGFVGTPVGILNSEEN